MTSRKGYTIVELILGIFGIAVIAIGGGLLYTAFHFIVKFW